jgi:hypothetical protein
MDIKVGDLVEFRKGLYADEEGVVYQVLEINGDRCFIMHINNNVSANYPIRLQSVAMVAELVLIADISEILGSVKAKS